MITSLLLIAGGVALLWATLPALRTLTERQNPRLHPYTTRKLAERRYRHFDDGKWVPWGQD